MRKRRLAAAVGGWSIGAIGLAVLLSMGRGAAAGSAAPADLFAKRILPIFNSPDPSSCTQCHLAGVDLKNYILPSSEKTFLSLRDQGLVDLDKPEKSKILTLIAMGEKPGGKGGAKLIRPAVATAEREAFAAWIVACAKDPPLRVAAKLKPAELASPARPVAIIRHARTDPGGGVLASFEQNVWSQRFRCMGCHSETGTDYQKLSKENGDIAWLGATPAETLGRIVSRNLNDTKTPEKSTLLAKPALLVKHGGGKKMEIGDEGYKAFRTFLEEYAKAANDGYRTPAELPAPPKAVRFGSDLWLKLENTPPAWADKVLEVRVFAFDLKTNAWEIEPIGIADRRVFGGGKLWQDSLILLAAAQSPRATALTKSPTLPAGRYLVKVYVDGSDKLAKDWQATLGPGELAGQAEVRSNWAAGYGGMTVVPAGGVRK